MGCSPIPSLRVVFCSSHVHCTHSLDGDILATATRSKGRDWEKHLSARLNSAIFFPLLLSLWTACSQVGLLPDEVVTDRWVSWPSWVLLSGQTHTQTLWHARTVHPPTTNLHGESLPWLGAASWAGVGEGVQEPLCHVAERLLCPHQRSRCSFRRN